MEYRRLRRFLDLCAAGVLSAHIFTVSVARAEPSLESPQFPWLARGTARVGTGLLPGAAVGGALHLGAARRWWSLELRAEGWPHQTATIPGAANKGAELWMLKVAPAGCLRMWPWSRQLRFDGCAGFGVVQMRARGFGISNPGQTVAQWGLFQGEFGAALALSRRWALRGDLELSWSPTRPRFVIERVGEVHRPSHVSAGGGLAVEVAF